MVYGLGDLCKIASVYCKTAPTAIMVEHYRSTASLVPVFQIYARQSTCQYVQAPHSRPNIRHTHAYDTLLLDLIFYFRTSGCTTSSKHAVCISAVHQAQNITQKHAPMVIPPAHEASSLSICGA